jgi:hypothetical protein
MRTHCKSSIAVALGLVFAGCSGDGDTHVDAGSDATAPASGGATDPAPAGLWVRTIEGVGQEGVNAATFNAGQPDEQVLALPDGESEAVLAHYEPDGRLRSLRADPLGMARGRIHLMPDGSSFVSGGGGFAAGSVSTPDDADVFVARFGADGTAEWASSAGGEAGMATATALAAWTDGSVAIGGTLEGTLELGVGEPNQTRLAANGEEIFLARYAADGALVWAKRAIAAPYLPSWKLAAAPDGGLLIYGALENVTTFNPGLGDETMLQGGNIGFVVKLDAAGDLRWARAFEQTTGMNGVSALAAFDDGSIVVTGAFDRMLPLGDTVLAAIGSDFPGRTQFPDLFVARLDADGEVTWARREGGEVWDGGNQVLALDDGAALVAGSYTNTVVFGEDERAETMLDTPVNESTAFLAVFEADGSLRWVRQGVAGQVAARSDGSIAIAEGFMGTQTLFAGERAETTLASAGSWDVYVVGLGSTSAAQ